MTSYNSSDYFQILDVLNSGQQNPVSLSGYGLTGTDTNNIKNLNSQIVDYGKSNNIGQILSAQTDMSGIMQKEQAYLKKRKQEIALDVETGERAMRLNDSTRKKYYSYVSIVLVWVGVLIVALVLVFLNRAFGVPFNLLFALVMALALFWTGWTLYQMSLRDPTDFDKLNLVPPNVGPNYVNPTNIGLWNAFGIDCIGPNCCPPGNRFGLVYDHSMNQCVLAIGGPTPVVTSGPTPLTGSPTPLATGGGSPTPLTGGPTPLATGGGSPTPLATGGGSPTPLATGGGGQTPLATGGSLGGSGSSPVVDAGSLGIGSGSGSAGIQNLANTIQNLGTKMSDSGIQNLGSTIQNLGTLMSDSGRQNSLTGTSFDTKEKSGFHNISEAENFMTIADLLSAYPPQFPMRLAKPFQHNYACETEQLYCNPKI